MINKPVFRLVGITLLVIGFLAACDEPTPTLTPSPSLSPTDTAAPTNTLPPQATNTLEPLGTSQNPLVFVFVPGPQDPDANMAGVALAEQLSIKTGYTIQTLISPSYSDLLEAFSAKSAHIAFFPPLTYLLAQSQGLANVILLTNHFGVYRSGSLFLANAGDPYTRYYDPVQKQSTADAAHALVQVAGKRPCLVDPGSTSGYVVPLGILAQESIITLPAVITQEQTSVIRALYAGRICDFGVTFGISGDPRTAESLHDLPDVIDRVVILWQSDAVIPNLNLSVVSGMSKAMQVKLRDGFLAIAQDPSGLDILSKAAGYEIAGMRAVREDEYATLSSFVEALSLDLEPLVGR